MLLYYHARQNPKYLFFRQFLLWLYPISGACTQAFTPKIKLRYRIWMKSTFLMCVQLWGVKLAWNGIFHLPSTPILPSPSLSPAERKVLVSLSVRALAPALKFCRNSLQKEHKPAMKPTTASVWHGPMCMIYSESHFSSSSSMKPLLSWSMMAKAFLTSSADLADRPTLAKKDL